jgi:hypothetical protein
MLTSEVNIGKIFIFFCLFAFFLSFFVPMIQYSIKWTVRILVPFKWLYFFYHDSWKDVSPTDYYYDYQLKHYAIKTDNSTAYKHYQGIMASQSDTEKLFIYCLAFLVATLLNFYAYTMNNNALFSVFIVFFNDNRDSLLDGVFTLPFYALYIFCFYFGVIRGCGISLHDENKYYCKNHGFKNL